MPPRRLRKSTIQDHFVYRNLRSGFMSKPKTDRGPLVYRITDQRGRTTKASSNEYFVSLALDDLGFVYSFQLSVAGGRQLSFGVVVDFLVETAPLPTPVWVHGDYWHTGAEREKDLRQQDIVKQYMAGSILEPVEIWGHESNTKEMALATVRRKLA